MMSHHPSLWVRPFRDGDRRVRYPGPSEKDEVEAATPRVLVAEDDPAMRALLVRALLRDGIAVSEARNGSEFVDQLGHFILFNHQGQSLDLVITDVRMPRLSGLDVLAGLRECDWAIPVVVITAFGDEEVHAEAQRLGAVAVFDKPFDLNEIRASWRRVLGRP